MKRWDYKNDPISPKKSGISSILLHIQLIQRKCCKCSKMFGKKEASRCIPCAYCETSSCRFCLWRCSYLHPNQCTTCHFVYKVRFPIHRPSTNQVCFLYLHFLQQTMEMNDKMRHREQNWVELLPSCNKSFHSTAFLAHLPRPLRGVGRLLRRWRCTGFQWQRCKPKRLLRNTGLLGLVENQKTWRSRDPERCPKNGP